MKSIAVLEFEKPIAELERMLAELRRHSDHHDVRIDEEVAKISSKLEKTKTEIYANLTSWQRIQMARHPMRPYLMDYLQRIAVDVVELHGDRAFRDDLAIVCGLATIDRMRLVFVGHQKGRDTKENLMRNFGCAHPEGYRKAMRAMRLASKFGLPIVCFIDTAGAFPGIGSEERHVAEAIAYNIQEMFKLRVPILGLVIGEGGSGGALGIGVADRVLIMENGYYSVISPEGCAGILWKDRAQAPQAADALKVTASHLLEMKFVEEIVPEPSGGAHRNWDEAASTLKSAILRHLGELKKLPIDDLLQRRYARYRTFGRYEENA